MSVGPHPVWVVQASPRSLGPVRARAPIGDLSAKDCWSWINVTSPRSDECNDDGQIFCSTSNFAQSWSLLGHGKPSRHHSWVTDLFILVSHVSRVFAPHQGNVNNCFWTLPRRSYSVIFYIILSHLTVLVISVAVNLESTNLPHDVQCTSHVFTDWWFNAMLQNMLSYITTI